MSNGTQRDVNSDKILSAFAFAALLIGVIVGVVLIMISSTVNNTGSMDFPGSNGFDLFYLGIGIACLVQGLFFYAVLRGFSDIICLLKRLSEK